MPKESPNHPSAPKAGRSPRTGILFLIGLIGLIGPIRPIPPAQAQTPLFDHSAWTNFTYVNNVMGLTATGDTLWLATTGGLVRFSADNPDSQTRFTNADGLGDIDLHFVALDSSRRIVAGGVHGRLSRRWSDQNWDVHDFEVEGTRIPLNSATPGPDGFLWIGSDIGVHKFDLQRNGGEIKESYTRLGDWPASNAVRDLLVANGQIWVVGPAGAARGNVRDQFLLVPEHWKTWSSITALNAVTEFKGHIFAGGDAGLYACIDTLTAPGDTVWTKIGLDGITISGFCAFGDTLWMATSVGLAIYTDGHAVSPQTLGSPALRLTSVARTSDGAVWAGRLDNGLLKFRKNAWTTVIFRGPLDGEFGDVAVGLDGKIWCVHPTRGADYLDSARWVTLPYYSVGTGGPGTSVAVAPDGEIWFGAWGAGAYKVNPANALSDWVHFDSSNSSLMWVKHSMGPNNYIVILDVAVDPQGRVWFANAVADSGRVIPYYDPEGGGCWGYFTRDDGFNSNNPAVLLALNHELLVGFGDKGLIDMTYTRALCRDSLPAKPPVHITSWSASNGLPSDEIRAILVDRADSLWVGTSVGLARWAADIRLFLKVPLPAEAGLSINTLAADALNNVWVGTNRGMVMIPTAGEAVFFSPENSGLVSSDVRRIAVNERTGEVWIATGAGLSRLAAGVPIAKSLDDVLAYPNPFELETGVLKLVRFNAPFGSRIFVFTVAGDPVTDFDAAAGWDGRNSEGNSVASGIYLFVARGPNGDTGHGKIAIIRRR